MRPLRALAALAAATTLTMTGCSGSGSQTDDPPTTPSAADAGDTAAEPTGDTDPATDPATEASEAAEASDAVVPECDGILLDSGAEIAGQELADCMAAAMFAAGTGSHVVEDADGTTEVDFRWEPEFAMAATGALTYVVTGDSGWVLMDGTWVHGNESSNDPMEMVAAGVVKTVRAFGDPRAITSMFAQTSWEVVEEGPVPTTGAVSDTAWLLEPQGSMSLLGGTVSGVRLWLGQDYLGVYYVATASLAGVTATTSNTFTQWGGAVEIPEPGA